MKIFGIDPGTQVTGFGIITFKNNSLSHIASGVVSPSSHLSMSEKIGVIYDFLDKKIKLHKPDAVSIETAFYGKNVQSTLKIGYIRGISLLAADRNKTPIHEYSPREIKKAVVGKGGASKEQVSFMINTLLSLGDKKMKLDESDALAAAVCHAFKKKSSRSAGGSWKSFVESNPERIIE